MYCETCKHEHGILYICEHYSDEVKADIGAKLEKWVSQLRDPEWVKHQTLSGVPPEVIAINRIFAGLKG
jgi:hypothetical protein